MRFGLDRMRALMTALGSPQEAFRAIHVVGTNGKSSTVRMIAAILAQPRRAHRRLPLAAPRLLRRAHPRRRRGRLVRRSSPPRVGRAHAAAEIVDRTLEPRRPRHAVRGADRRRLRRARATRRRRRGRRGRPRRALGRDERHRRAGRGADERRPRAHALARPDDRRHRAREARRGRATGATLVLGADLHPDADAEARIAAERRRATIVRAPRRPDALAPGVELARPRRLPAAQLRRRLRGRARPTSATLDAGRRSAPPRRRRRVPGRFEVVADGAGELVLDGAHNAARHRRARRVAAAVPRGPPARRGRLGARRQGRRRDARAPAGAVRRASSSRPARTRARCRRTRSPRWPASCPRTSPRASRPTRAARCALARELAGRARRRARDRLDLPRRRPRAARRRRRRGRCCERERPVRRSR